MSYTELFLDMDWLQISVSVAISLIGFYLSLLTKNYYEDKRFRNNFILDKHYTTHDKVLDTLRQFFEIEEFKYSNIPTKPSKSDKDALNISWNDFSKKPNLDLELMSGFYEVTFFQDMFNFIEKNLKVDIYRLSKISSKKVQKIAQNINGELEKYVEESSLISDLLMDELGPDVDGTLNEKEKVYIKRTHDSLCKLFLIEIIPMLKNLEKSIVKIVSANF